MTSQRRQFLRLCGVVGIGALAGCTDTSTESPTGTAETTATGTTTQETTPDPAPQWNRTYGTGDGNDALFGAAEGIDGGHFVVGGSTAATGGEEFDEWAVKLDSEGETEWDRVSTDDE